MTRTYDTWNVLQRAAFLASVRLFSTLSEPALQHIAARFRVRRFQRGAFVFLRGMPAAELSLLATGRIKVVRETEDGREVILRQITPTDIFGAAGGWGESVYPASAVAQDDAVVFQMPATEFSQLLRSSPDLAVAVIAELGLRLRQAEARIRDLQTERADRRLARALLRLAEQRTPRSPVPEGAVLPLSRQDLAELAGTTLSTASRTLSRWDQQGIVAAQRERVVLLKPAALAALVGDLPPEIAR
ncbi:MAG: Crp/Fnr family transcriptional regulator [Chloroflexi bacterium]|nr:Crp/Fnr family transcriptional regulator [Chloroflexota bacterium]